MSKGSNVTFKAIGIGLVILGIGLAYWGYQSSETLGSQISQKLTGAHSDKEMQLFIGGAVSFVVGLFLLIKK